MGCLPSSVVCSCPRSRGEDGGRRVLLGRNQSNSDTRRMGGGRDESQKERVLQKKCYLTILTKRVIIQKYQTRDETRNFVYFLDGLIGKPLMHLRDYASAKSSGLQHLLRQGYPRTEDS